MRSLRESVDGRLSDVDGIVRLHGVTWSDYLRLLRMRGDHSGPRITYLSGEVEIMSPGRSHESIKSFIGRLVEVFCLEHDIEFTPVGSWTVKSKPDERGAEPDECYVFGNAADASRPDLAIEVEWTRGRIDKLEVYRKLGVREVWYWRDARIEPYWLRGERYRLARSSRVLPGIDLPLIASLIAKPTVSQAVKEYQRVLRKKSR
jgi:Uma2 family endonuclease